MSPRSCKPVPVVLVHRAGGKSSEFDEVLERLRAVQPRRVFAAVDLPGRRRSADHPGRMSAMAEHVVDRVIELQGGPALLVGHSMGGAVSLLAALDFPAWVSGLVVIGSSAGTTIPCTLATIMDDEATFQGRAMAVESLSPSLDPARRDALLARMGRVPFSVLRADLKTAGMTDLGPRLGELTVPVRILVGQDDRLVPPDEGMMLEQAVPGATLRVLHGKGHMMQWEAVDEIADEVLQMAASLDRG